jgi:hypothetical protein
VIILPSYMYRLLLKRLHRDGRQLDLYSRMSRCPRPGGQPVYGHDGHLLAPSSDANPYSACLGTRDRAQQPDAST